MLKIDKIVFVLFLKKNCEYMHLFHSLDTQLISSDGEQYENRLKNYLIKEHV